MNCNQPAHPDPSISFATQDRDASNQIEGWFTAELVEARATQSVSLR